MTVTAIEKRRKGLSALYIDGELAVKVDTEVLLSSKVVIGTDIDDEELLELITQSNIKRAKDKAMWLISYRDHSRKELIDKVAKDCDKDSAIKAVERLEQLGLVDDERFARRYAASLLDTKRMSPSGAVRKLTEKGIDRDLARDIVDELNCDIESNIRAVIDKKYASHLSDEKGRRRCVSALMRLGYSYSDITSVLNTYTDIDNCEY